MKLGTLICAGLTVLACGSAAAQNSSSSVAAETGLLSPVEWTKSFTLSDSPSTKSDPNASLAYQEKAQAFRWGLNERWMMNLNMVSRPVESPLPREEMRAGATYQFTPRFSLGGTVSVGAQELDDVNQWKEQEVQAGVKLKTTFKF
jgi:hypothetical protein